MEPERRRLGIGALLGIGFAIASVAVMGYGMAQTWTRTVSGRPFPTRREGECQRSCTLLQVEYADVTDYGCFCRDEGEVFVVGSDSWAACD